LSDGTSLSLLGVASLLTCVGVVYGRLIVGGVLSSDVARLLECASDEVALSALTRVLLIVTG
jgi:hypothetical protein